MATKRLGLASVLVTALLLASSAVATEAMASESKEPTAAEAAKAGFYFTMSPVVLPIVVDRRPVNFVAVRMKLILSPEGAKQRVSDKENYLREALLREWYRAPLIVPDDHTVVDQAKTEAMMLKIARNILGTSNVRGVMLAEQIPQKK